MPSHRGPSKGCFRCRELKVKVLPPIFDMRCTALTAPLPQCDQNKPCQRCRKAQKECKYQDEFDRLHRDQSSHAKEAAETKWRKRADPIKNCLPQEDSSTESSPRSEISLYEQAYRRFCYDFVTPFPGALSRLPQLLFENPPESCLCSAVAAVAYANFYSRCKSDEAREAAAIYYGKTLQRFAAVMIDPVQIQQDDNLMVIFLMSMYEVSCWISEVSSCFKLTGLDAYFVHARRVIPGSFEWRSVSHCATKRFYAPGW